MPNAAAIADELTSVERQIHDPAVPVARLGELGREQQLAYRAVLVHPDWRAAVLASVATEVRPTVEANLTAQDEIVTLAPKRSAPPPWRVRSPRPPDELLAAYHDAEGESGVPWYWLAAIHLVETDSGRILSPSTAGAQGPMQFLPSTWAAYGRGDINSDRDAILAAGRFLRANGGAAAMDRALLRYNPSPHYVRAVSAYAGQMREGGERVWRAYYAWRVYVLLTTGDALLPEAVP